MSSPLKQVYSAHAAPCPPPSSPPQWVGIHREPQTLVRTLRHLRRQVDVNTEVCVGRGEMRCHVSEHALCMMQLPSCIHPLPQRCC